MNIKICDGLCGTGKTSAAIRMMNTNKDRKFIFVTQYLSEVNRILEGCKEVGFVAPNNDEMTKLKSLNLLLEEGDNIATTHALFLGCDDRTLELIRSKNYTLVLDEAINVFNETLLGRTDIEVLTSAGAIEIKNEEVIWTDKFKDSYDEFGKFKLEMHLARSKRLIKLDDKCYFWSIPPELFACFSDVYVLTYMFQGQPLKCFFDFYSLPYEYIGVKYNNRSYDFCDLSEMDRRLDIRNLVHVLDHKKLNAIGDKRNSLSFGWFTNSYGVERKNKYERLRKNIYNLRKNIYKCNSKDFMWTVFKSARYDVAAYGLSSNFVSYSTRACNDYVNKKYLAYCVNNFPNPLEVRFYKKRGIDWNGDAYAVSILIQWLFRSAIRRGEEVWIYIPSRRMRSLLIQWMENLAQGKDLAEVSYTSKK